MAFVVTMAPAVDGKHNSVTASEPFLGQTQLFGFTFAPRGWALCDGQLLAINENAALFSLLGTIYGGDGRTTFALPDLRGGVPIHFGHGPGLSQYMGAQKVPDGRFRRVCLNARGPLSLAHARETFADWRQYHDEERPRGAISDEGPIALTTSGHSSSQLLW